jgi:selenocysteine-specific elongation factor
MPTHLILGTAGHIDHGKTALVRALTGIDTDRLPEEKKRGITIDLGFAELNLEEYCLGIVDVPGHERFIRNMLAGATGIDIAIFVVAADDSVKPQTREHLEILRLLNLSAGVIALTKCDVAESEWIDLVESEVRELVQDTFLADAPIVRTSAVTGMGIDELKKQMLESIKTNVTLDESRTSGPFRMAVDGTFSLAGHGTIARGSVLRGVVNVGDELHVCPSDRIARVRSLQTHGRNVMRIERGQRAAVNLAGVTQEELFRGSELASPNLLRPSRLLGVELAPIASTRSALKHRQRIRIHLGTTEVIGRVLLQESGPVPAKERRIAQLLLETPVTTAWGQPFVIRSESPVKTIGGGRVLAPECWKFRRTRTEDWNQLKTLCEDNALLRAAAAVYFFRWQQWVANDLNRSAGIDEPEKLRDQLLSDDNLIGRLRISPSRELKIHQRHLDQLGQDVVKKLTALHEEHPRNLNFPQSQLEDKLRFLGDRTVAKAILERLAEKKIIRMDTRGISLPDRGPKLSSKEAHLLQEVTQQYHDAGLRPPSVSEIQKQAAHNRQSIPQLIKLAEAQGVLIRLTEDLLLHTKTVESLRLRLHNRYGDGTGFTVSEIREELEISRKFAVPICEYLDRIGFTQRNGNLRVLTGT